MADSSPYKSSLVDLSVLKGAIETDMTEFVAGSEQGVKSLIEMNLTLFERLNTLENNQSRLCSLLETRDGKIDRLLQELNVLKYENDALSLKIATVDDSTRIMNLRIEGLVESQNENIKQATANCLSRSGVTCSIADIDFARRIGKRNG